MIHPGEYPSKIMLVGEYGVVIGGSALTIPFSAYKARIRSVGDIPAGKEELSRQSQEYLQQLYEYIQGIPADTFHAAPNLKLFSENLKNYWFDLNIPVGFGLGSSGAVSAAIYDLFFPGGKTLPLLEQKEDLAAIESYFHGRSSGVDALTCYARTALRFHADGNIERPNFDPSALPGNYRLFLLNSEERFDTGPLVRKFLSQMKDPGFKRSMEEEYLPLNQLLIEALLGEREADPAMLVKMLSDFQLRYFRNMIPEKAIDLWIEGQVSNEYYLKLNGSGGGMMLGITHESFSDELEERWGENILWIGKI